MKPHFSCVTLIGVGILGGSIGRALKSRNLADHIIGVGHRKVSLDKALEVNAIDEASMEAAQAVRNADLIVIATPAALVTSQLDLIRKNGKPDAVVTDVASTKARICIHADQTWPAPRRFIGSHPMAGSEKFGPEHSTPDFYENSVCLVEQPGANLDDEAHNTIVNFWQLLGAKIIAIDPRQHDLILAHTSHLPHVVAAVVATLAASQGDIKDLIGNGFKDTTRIASSRPEVWRDICLTNRAAILDGLKAYLQATREFRDMLQNNDAEGLYQFFEKGREARNKVMDP